MVSSNMLTRGLVISLVAALALCAGTGCDVDDSVDPLAGDETATDDGATEATEQVAEGLGVVGGRAHVASNPDKLAIQLGRAQAADAAAVDLVDDEPAVGGAKGGLSLGSSNESSVSFGEVTYDGDMTGDRKQNPAGAGSNKGEPEPDPWNPGEPEPDPWHPGNDR